MVKYLSLIHIYPDPGTDGHADSGTHRNAHGGTDGNTDCRAHRNAHGGTDGHAHSGTDGHAPVSYTHLQRLSVPHIVAQLCHWRDNWCARGASIPVLSY